MAAEKPRKPTIAAKKRKDSLTDRPVTTLAHQLHTLLHTVRAIGQVEDELCTLLHAVEHQADVSRELGQLLARVPAHGYVAEIEAIQGSLAATKAASKPPAKRASMVKQRAKAAKKSVRVKKPRAA